MKVYRFLIVFFTILLIVGGVLISDSHEITGAGALVAGGLGLIAIALSLGPNKN